jgi:uncharacterized protein (TIGR00251 family)
MPGWRSALRIVDEETISLELYVEPGSSRRSFGPYDPWRQRIKVAVRARAEKGKANDEVMDLLGEVLGTPVTCVRLLRGNTTRRKCVQIDGVDTTAAVETLDRLLVDEEAPSR